ncbi:hypothetical protein MFIFM68171_01826 [Madurella fahalii]|uniref:Uncharacterized protein n=1 Tax=Madurella fahalii TaxID=1157608 RepID=A0ABQ0G1I0_9PEZI
MHRRLPDTALPSRALSDLNGAMNLKAQSSYSVEKRLRESGGTLFPGNEPSRHLGLEESGIGYIPHQTGMAAESGTQVPPTPTSPMITGQTRQHDSAHQMTQAAGGPNPDSDRAEGFGNEKASTCPDVIDTGDGTLEQGVLDVAGPGGQDSDSVSDASVWSINAQHGSSSPSQASRDPSAPYNEPVATASSAEATDTYIQQRQRDRHPRIPEFPYEKSVDEEQEAIVAQAIEPLGRLRLSTLGPNDIVSPYLTEIVETMGELILEDSDLERVDEM